MKILHTADWHIGKLVHKIHMTQDQEYILRQLIDLVKEEEPHVMVIAGDIYDRSIPPTEAVELLDSVLTEILSETGTRIIMISGNHDNPERLKFGSSILKSRGLHIATKIDDIYNPVIIEDDHGPVYFHTVPFIETEIVRDHFNDEEIRSCDQAMKRIIDSIETDTGTRHVCITHGYISSGTDMVESESEKPYAIGGSERVASSHFSKFNYTALGHLHGPQVAGSENIRYCGSLMKYSFSEVNQDKGVLLIDLNSESLKVEKKSFSPMRDFRIIRGDMEDLIDQESEEENNHDYIKALLTDNGELINPFSRLKSIYPNLLALDYDRGTGGDSEIETGKSGTAILKENPADLFEKFYNLVEDESLSDNEKEIIGSAHDEIRREERNS